MALDLDLRELSASIVAAVLSYAGVPPDDALVEAIVGILMVFTVIGMVLGAIAPGFVWVMRKIMAHMQARQGPMRVGPHGILQPVADGVKLFTKEDVMPARADPFTFKMAPYVMFVPAAVAFAPIPFGNGIIVSDLRVGLLFILAVSAISPLGEILAGWGSNNKFAIYGGLRAAALDVAYEIPMVLAVISVILLAGSISTVDVVDAQHKVWFVFLQPLGFFIFFVAGLARIGVVPMDLPEAESELVAGYFTEYSGMRFGLFFVTVFASIYFVSALATVMFLGGGAGPLLPPFVWFLAKSLFLSLAIFVIWFTLPRVRIDQFLAVCWKVLFPLALVNLVMAAVIRWYLGDLF